MKNSLGRICCAFSCVCLWACGLSAADESRTVPEWRQLAEKGDAAAQFHYAEMLRTAQGVPRDEAAAMVLLRKSAEQGYAKAQAAFGKYMKSGTGVETDIVAGLVWLEKAAEQGDTDAQTTVGLCYINGDGTPRNEVAGAKWLERASKAGSSRADSAFTGIRARGVPKTDADAFIAYRISAQNNDALGMVACAACLEEGRGIAKDEASALKWYLVAANRGDLLAKYRAGLLMKDKLEKQAEAYEWLSIAAVEGIASARTVALALEKNLAPDALAKAKATVAAKAKPLAGPGELAKAPAPGIDIGAVKRMFASMPKSSGSGFFVSTDGFLVTNHHVVNGGKRFEIERRDGDNSPPQKHPATLVRADAACDLAILKVEGGEFPALAILDSDKVKSGDRVGTFGFPRPDNQGQIGKFTDGRVNGLAGMRDDPKMFQVNVPIGPGSSGGALFCATGKVVGIISGTLNPRVSLFDNSPPPQDVNYAVKSKYLLELLGQVPDWKNHLPKPEKGVEKLTTIESPVIEKAKSAAVLIMVYEQ